MENLVIITANMFTDGSLLDDQQDGMGGAVVLIAIFVIALIMGLFNAAIKAFYAEKIAPITEPKITRIKAAYKERKENSILRKAEKLNAQAEKINTRRAHRAQNNEWNALAATCAAGQKI